MSAADAPPAPTRADEIVVAITEAIIAAQRNPGSSRAATSILSPLCTAVSVGMERRRKENQRRR